MNWFMRAILFIARVLSAIGEKLADWIVIFATTFAILLAAITFCAMLTHISWQAGIQPISLFKSVSDTVLNIFSVDVKNLSPDEYFSILSTFLYVSIFLVTLLFIFLPWVVGFKNRWQARRKQTPKVLPVHVDGVDDIAIMYKYFHFAEEVTVYSGDFSWIMESQEMQCLIVALAKRNKLRFISYKTEDEVKRALNDASVFDSLRPSFVFGSGKRIKCSIVSYTGEKVFLYKLRTHDQKIHMCILTADKNTRYLLEALYSLCK